MQLYFVVSDLIVECFSTIKRNELQTYTHNMDEYPAESHMEVCRVHFLQITFIFLVTKMTHKICFFHLSVTHAIAKVTSPIHSYNKEIMPLEFVHLTLNLWTIVIIIFERKLKL
jgi:hypothetical protein